MASERAWETVRPNKNPNKHELLVKLLNTLPTSIQDQTTLNIVENIVDPQIIDIDLGDTTRKRGGFIQESYGLCETKIDVIFHLAALPRIQASFENPNEVFKSNVISTQNILDWA